MTKDKEDFGLLVPILTTADINGTIAFYRDTLGFEVTATFPEDEPTWCHLKRGDAHVMFTSPGEPDHDDDHDHDHADAHGHDHDHDHDHADAHGGSGLWALYVYPDEVDALWQKLKETTEVAYPPFETDYGMREFGIRDPNGFMLSFGREI